MEKHTAQERKIFSGFLPWLGTDVILIGNENFSDVSQTSER